MKDDWQPEPANWQAIISRHSDLDCQTELDNFRDHWIGKGERRADWNASLRTWMRNADKWKSLTDSQRRVVDMACGDANIWSMGRAEASQGDAIAFHQSKGVTVHKWPDESIAAFQKAWNEVAEEQAASNPDFNRIYQAYKAFRDKYAPWKELGYLK